MKRAASADSEDDFQTEPESELGHLPWQIDPQVLQLLREEPTDAYEKEEACQAAMARIRRLHDASMAATTDQTVRSLTEGNQPVIRCPLCGTPNSIASLDGSQNVECSGCKGNFAVLEQFTSTVQQPRRKLGRFELIEEIGSGSFGTVWRALDCELQRYVALKIPRREAVSERDVQKFLHEARSAAGLKHPGIVSIHEIGKDQGTIYIVSDLVEGRTLEEFLAHQRMSARESARLCSAIAEALHHAHQSGIVHRDLKPGNIGLDHQLQPFVMDFGLALRNSNETTLTSDGKILGTPAYMAPEQARGDGNSADARSDVYALGVILYELLTGERPFRGNLRMLLQQVLHDEPPHPRTLNQSVPIDLATICLKCLEKSPDRRYSTALELKEDLDRFLNSVPIIARPISSFERCLRWCDRNRIVASLASLLFLSLILGIGLTTWKWREAVTFAELAKGEQSKAERSADSLQSQSAWLQYQKGRQLCENQQSVRGLNWMHQALSSFPKTPEADRARRLVWDDLLAWRQQLPKRRWWFQTPNDVLSFSISPDGKTLVSGEMGGAVRRFDLSSGQELGEPIEIASNGAPSFGVWGLCFHPDGKSFLACSGAHSGEEGLARVTSIDLETGKEIEVLSEFPGFANEALYSPSGTRIAIVGGKFNGAGSLRIKDLSSETPPAGQLQLPNVYHYMAFSDDEQHLWLEDGKTGVLRCVNLTSGEFVELEMLETTRLQELLSQVQIRIQEWRERQELVKKESNEWLVETLLPYRMHPSSSLILTRDYRETLQLIDAVTQEPIQSIASGAKSFCWSPAGQCFAASEGSQIRVWNMPPLSTLRTTGSRDPAVAHSSQMKNSWLCMSVGHHIAVASAQPHAARIIDLKTGLPLGKPLVHPLPTIRVAAVSPCGQYCATACQSWESIECLIRLWDLQTGDPLTTWMPQENWVATIAFTPDGKKMVASNYAALSWVFDLEPIQDIVKKGELQSEGQLLPLQKIGTHIRSKDIVISSAISPDGKRLMLGTASDWSGKPLASLWDLETRQQLFADMPHDQYVSHVDFSADGDLMLTCSSDGLAKVWSALDGRLISSVRFSGSAGPVKLVGDGKMLLTGSSDGVVKLWDTQNGKNIDKASLARDGDRATAVAVSPDSSKIVVGYSSGAAQLVDRESFLPIGPARILRSAIHTVEFESDGKSWTAMSDSGSIARWETTATTSQTSFEESWLVADRMQLQLETGYVLDAEGLSVMPLSKKEWTQLKELTPGRADQSNSTNVSGKPEQIDFLNCLNFALEDSNLNAIEYLLNRTDRDSEILPIPEWQVVALRGDCSLSRGDRNGAEENYCRSQQDEEVLPLVGNWQRYRVVSAIGKEDWPQAEWYLDKLVQSYPTDWTLLRDRAEVYASQGKSELANADVDRALELAPDRRFVLKIASQKCAGEKWKEAAELYDQVASQGGYDSLQDMANHVICLVVLKDSERLKNCLKSILDDTDRRTSLTLGHGRSVVTLCTWGSLHEDDIPRMIQLAERAYKRELLNEQAIQRGLDLQHFGLALYRAGEFDRSIEALQESRELVGGDTKPCMLGLALAYASKREFDKAREFSQSLQVEAYLEELPNDHQKIAFQQLVGELEALMSRDELQPSP